MLTGIPWTPNEDKILIERFPTEGPSKVLAVALGRTRESIRTHARKMGLKRIYPLYELDPKIEWRFIEGYNNEYKISENGIVVSLFYRRTEALVPLRPGLSSSGYLTVVLRQKSRPIHELVAESFICCRPYGLIVNHKDGNKLNNHWTNLEWTTYRGNARHSLDVLGQKIFKGSMSWNSKRYRVKSPEGIITEILCLDAFCRPLYLDPSSMCKVANGKIPHHKGWLCEHL